MANLSDARFDALRALGYQGSTSDMLLRWLIDNAGEPPTYGPNLHVNPELAGGDISGPRPGIPTPDFRDTFTGADGTALPTHTPEAGTWTALGSNCVLSANGTARAATSGSGAGPPNFWSNLTDATTDTPKRIEWRCTASSDGTGLVQGITVLTSADGADKVTLGVRANGLNLQRFQGGDFTTELVASIDRPANGEEYPFGFYAEVDGTTVLFGYGDPLDPIFEDTFDFSDLTNLGTGVGIILRASAAVQISELTIGDSGEVSPENAPDGHNLGFNTAPSRPLDNGDGTFDWECNYTEVPSGRTYLNYRVENNNPGLTVGSKYRFEAVVETVFVEGNTTPVAVVSRQSNITVTALDNNCAPNGQTRRIFAEFTIDDPTWTADVRAGVGVTTNRPDHFILRGPPLFREVISDPVPPAIPPNTIPDAWKAMLLQQTGLPEEHYHRNDYWYFLLGTLGYTQGSLNDRELAFWSAGGDLSTPGPFSLITDDGEILVADNFEVLEAR